VTLTGLGEKAHLGSPNVNLDTHILDVVNVFKYEQIEHAVLIGHSYGGMVITGVADRIASNIEHLVYADAVLPENGESLFDVLPENRERWRQVAKEKGDGWKILPFWQDWGLDVPHPLATFEQPISLNNPLASNIPATYILTIEPEAEVDAFSPFALRAKKRGWPVIELPTGHNLQRTMPNEYADILLNVSSHND
jgi:pimeloyl-ACP methyl ester carboxylesterase